MKRAAGGFTLVEVMLALFLMGVGILAAAPLFVHAMQGNASGADMGTVGAAAVARMEQLRGEDYDSAALNPGGSLGANSAGYFDASDPTVLVRWQVQNNASPAGSKTITVRAVAARRVVGRAKGVTLTTIRGD